MIPRPGAGRRLAYLAFRDPQRLSTPKVDAVGPLEADRFRRQQRALSASPELMSGWARARTATPMRI